MPARHDIRRVISGGQTGVDRAALDLALDHGLPCGGWCPAGRAAEDRPIPAKYPLRETISPDPNQRTEWNARDADATLVLTMGEPSGGTAYTVEILRKLRRPHLVVDLDGDADAAEVRRWIERQAPHTLNVAGPRESESPGIYGMAKKFLSKILLIAPHEGVAVPNASKPSG